MKAMFCKSFEALEKNLVDYISENMESQSMLQNKLLERDLKDAKLDNVRLQRELSTARKDLATKENAIRKHECETSSASMTEAELHNAKEALSAALLEKETLAKDLRNAKDLLKKHEHNIAELHKDITHAKGKYEQSIDQLSASEANLQAVKDEVNQCRKQQQSLKDEVFALKEQLAQYMNGPARDWTHAVKSGKNQQNVHSTRQDETPPEDRVLKDNVSFPTSTRNTTGGQRPDLDLLILGNSHTKAIPKPSCCRSFQMT